MQEMMNDERKCSVCLYELERMAFCFFSKLYQILAIIICHLFVLYLILSFIWTPHSKVKQKVSSKKLWSFPDIYAKDVNCAKLIRGDYNEEVRANEIMFPHKKDSSIAAESYYSNVKENCVEFIRQRSYLTHYLTEEEREFPIAFSLLVYKDIVQVERLLRAVYRPQNFYCIHVDAKSPQEFLTAMHSIASCFKNVFLSRLSVDVTWGQFGVVEAELVCMEELLKYKWKYFINLTGQEFPLRTNLELVNILQNFKGTNDIQGSIRRRNIHRTLSKEPAPHDLVLTKGAVHIVAVRGFIDFVINDRRALDLLKWLNGTFVPDETFFSTLNHNPHLGIPGSYNGSLEAMEDKPSWNRYKLWYPSTCNGIWQRGLCVFNVGDLSYMVKSHQLFANKFEEVFSHLAYDCLEEWHRNRTRDEYLETEL